MSSRSCTIDAPPRVLDVALHEDAERPVVPRRPEAAVDVARREDEATSLAEVDDALHEVGLCHETFDRTRAGPSLLGARRVRATRRCGGVVRSDARVPRRRDARPRASPRHRVGRRAHRGDGLRPRTRRRSRVSGRTRRPPKPAQPVHTTPPSSRSKVANMAASDASPQRTHVSSTGWNPSSESSFQKNAALTSGDGSARQRLQGVGEHPVDGRVRLTLGCDLVDRLEHRHRMGERSVVLPEGTVRVDRLDLGDHVELTPAVALERHVARRLQPGTEPAAGLAHPLGDGPDPAVRTGEEGDDPVGLPELDGAEDHTLIPVEPWRSRHECNYTRVSRSLTRCRWPRSDASDPGTRGSRRRGRRGGSRARARR